MGWQRVGILRVGVEGWERVRVQTREVTEYKTFFPISVGGRSPDRLRPVSTRLPAWGPGTRRVVKIRDPTFQT